ncbi:hypothetical protein AB0I81_32255 [Nonomuraea sp. NPDC050404]|uniref:hypothetical protein n=1 Tax=Nonomuraea sp. NPDC050404 TaxID=3155783 RepID=UPI0033D187A2
MAPEERSAWVMVVVSAVSYVTYVAIILASARTVPLTEVPYATTLLWTVGGAIVAGIVLAIAITIAWPDQIGKKDQRDREIHRYGEYTGQWCLVAGGVAGLAMAMAEVDHFYIANVLYLAFVLSSILGSVLKIIAYRRGLPTW